MNFANPEYTQYIVFGIIAALSLSIYGIYAKRKSMAKFASSKMLLTILNNFSPKRQTVKVILLLVGLIFLGISIIGPQWGRKHVEETFKGCEIIIALDCSQSMMAQDYKPSRLDFSKTMLIKLVDRLKGNKIGIIAYAGEAFMECPLTTDSDAAKLFIDYADYNAMPVQGTDIGSAISLAESVFSPDTKAGKAIIILSDGESHTGNLKEAAAKAAEEGITIYTIGVGSPEGITLVVDENVKKDKFGNDVISKLDETALKEIAAKTGGIYVKAAYDDKTIDAMVQSIMNLNKDDLQVQSKDRYIHRYQYTLVLAFIFLFVGFIIGERRPSPNENK